MAKLELRAGLLVANRIVAAVRKLMASAPYDMGNEFHVESYSNGREQGLCIVGWHLRVCFAENRNSDAIVVYMSQPNEHFSMGGNIPTDRAYEERTFFNPGEEVKAASFIWKAMQKDYKALQKELRIMEREERKKKLAA